MTALNYSTDFKICSCCGENKPRTEYYKAKCCLDGLRGECKPCVAKKQKVYNQKNAQAIAQSKKKNYAKNRELILQQHREYYKKNSEKIKTRAKQFVLDNPEHVKLTRAEYHRKNKEVLLFKKREYRKNNKEHVKRLHKEWCERNKERYREIKRQAKYKRKNVEGKLSKGITQKLLKLQKGKCACCGKLLKNNYQLDHIIPLALGGKNTDDNVQLLTAECNNRKHTKDPIEYMQSQGYLL